MSYTGIASVTSAVTPVLKAGVAAKCSVVLLVAVLALVLALIPAYSTVVTAAAQPKFAGMLCAPGNCISAASSTGFATLPFTAAPQLARFDAHGQSSPRSVLTPFSAQTILVAPQTGSLPFIDPVVSPMNTTLSG